MVKTRRIALFLKKGDHTSKTQNVSLNIKCPVAPIHLSFEEPSDVDLLFNGTLHVYFIRSLRLRGEWGRRDNLLTGTTTQVGTYGSCYRPWMFSELLMYDLITYFFKLRWLRKGKSRMRTSMRRTVLRSPSFLRGSGSTHSLCRYPVVHRPDFHVASPSLLGHGSSPFFTLSVNGRKGRTYPPSSLKDLRDVTSRIYWFHYNYSYVSISGLVLVNDWLSDSLGTLTIGYRTISVTVDYYLVLLSLSYVSLCAGPIHKGIRDLFSRPSTPVLT